MFRRDFSRAPTVGLRSVCIVQRCKDHETRRLGRLPFNANYLIEPFFTRLNLHRLLAKRINSLQKMKRAWQEDPVYATEIESAMKVAAVMFDLDEDVDDWDRNFPSDMEADCGLEKGCYDDNDDNKYEDEEKDDDEELDLDYVRNFDRLYVQKVVGWIDDGKNVFITGSRHIELDG